MSDIETLAESIIKRAGANQRYLIAIAAPPGAGKSTLSAALVAHLGAQQAAVVPMDGFHYDDSVLDARGLRSRKGAPETYDFGGLKSLLGRIRANAEDVAIPIFDRSMELSRAAAAIVPTETRFVLVEGNYLLLDEEPWRELAPLFDLTVMLDVPRTVLYARLVDRWRQHGKSEEEGAAWIASNDMPNIDRVLAHSRTADLTVSS